MKLFKRILSGIIATALSVSVVLELPKEVFSKFPDIINTLKVYATNEVASGVCGENLTWTIDVNGVLTIDGTGDMYTYEYTSDTAKHPTYSVYDSVITKVVIGENVASLSPYAFICYYSVNYNKLTEVEIKSTLMTEIPDYCFCQCPSLSKVKLPNQITTIEMNAFSSCPITSINMPSQLEIIGAWAFYKSQFTNLKFPYGLKKIERNAFEYSKIEEAVIPETVTTIGEEAFYYSELKKLTLHDKGLSIGRYSFSDSKLEELILPPNVTFEYDSATGMGYNFSSTPIKKLYIEEGVNSIEWGAFSSCRQLEEIHFPSTIKSIGRASFSGCINLKTAKLPDSITSIGINAFSGCEKCEDFINLKLPANLKSLGSGAFSETGVESIYIPKTLTNLESSWGFFEGNYRFTSLKFKEYIVDPQNPEYSSIDGVLYNKEQTQVIDYPLYKEDEVYIFPSSVSVMSNTGEKNDIAYNKYIKTIIFPDDTGFEDITQLNDTVERENHNQSIETIILPRKNIPVSTWAFSYLDNLKVLYIPSEITEFKGSILLNCPNAVIYCQAGSAAETHAKTNNYKYKIVNGVKIDNGYVIFPSEITLGGVKHITPEVIGEVDLSDKEISWNSDDSSINVLSYVNENGSPRVNFIARELGEHTINMVIDDESYTLTFNVVEEKATGFIGTYVKSNVDNNGVFVPKEWTLNTNGKLYDDAVYVNELRYWIEQLGYDDLFSDYLAEHTYEELLSLEIAMPIRDSSGDEYLWTNTDITVRDMMTYIIFMDDNKSYLENMEKELSDATDYLYQSKIYALNYQNAYDYLMNLYIANCELESDLTGNEVMMKYLSVIAYGIIATENNTINSKTYSYIKKFDELQIDDVADQESDFLGFIISGGDTNELAYSIQNDVSKAKEAINDGYTVFNAIRTVYDYETGKTTQEKMLLDLVLDSYLPTYADKLEKGKYISQEYIDYCKNTTEFIDITKSTISAIVDMYTKPTGLLIGLPVKLSMKYIKQVKGVFEDAEKQDAGWYILTMYTFKNDESKLGAYIDPESFKIRSLLESNLNFSTNTVIENGIMEDYENKYALGDGSFATLPSDAKILVLYKAAQTANFVKETNTEVKAEELLQHMLAQIAQNDMEVVDETKEVTITANNYSINVGDSIPMFGYTVSGIDDGDTLPITPVITCEITNTDTAGTYTITISGASEMEGYKFIYVDGILTVEETKITPTYVAPTPNTLAYNGSAQALISVGAVTTGGTMKYSLDGVSYTTTIPTATNADTYNVYWMVEGDAPNYNDITCDEPIYVTIAKVDPVLTTIPAAITGLGYTGEAQALITAGATADSEIQYSVDGTTYISTVPTGIAVGDYTVYYKIIGDRNHNDKTFDPITVSIGKGVAPVITEPTATAIEYGQTLSASALSDSAWSWENGTEIPTVMNSGYNAVMTVTDDNNYDYSTVMGYNALTHTITRTVMVNVTPATPTVVVKVTPAADITGKPISATAIVINSNNASLFDTPTAELSYSINGVTQPFTGSFVIPEETPEGTVITITATTMANGNYAAGYGTTTVIVTSCIHENKTLMSDAESHWYECLNCGADIDKTTHSGDTATCNSKATCGICNTVYGEFDSSNHAYNVSTAWTTENGYHWHECNGCGADLDKGACTGGTATCMTAALCETCGIAHGDVDTNNHANNVSAAWSSDSEYHWHECACGADIDKTTHSGGTADCMNKAKCEACGTEHGTVDTSNHANNVSAAWSSDGTNHYHECACGAKVDTAQCSGGTATCMTAAICDVCRNEHGTTDISNHADVSPTWTSDGTNHWHECACGADLDKGACTGGTATCTNKAVCITCQQAYGEINSNNHADKETVWSKGGTGHWHACGCGKLDFAVHTSSGEATEDTAETCIICGYVIAPATGHIKHTADTSKWLSDETNHWHKCVGCEEKMDTAAHTFGDWQTETEPTTTTEGKKTRTCSTCFYTDEEAIPVIGTVAAPVFSPASTSFNGPINVTITTATDGAIIYYTTDDSTPTTSSKKYTGTITVTSTTTIKAIAVKDGMADSKVSSVTYTKQEGGGYNPSPNPTPTPTPTPIIPDDEPQIKGDNGKTGWDAIKDEIENADDGDTIVIDMNGTTEVPEDVFEQIAGQDIDIVIELDNGFIWTINGEDIRNPKNVDLGINKRSYLIPIDVINSVTSENNEIQLELEHNGEFGFTATLTVILGKKNDGLVANLFYYTKKNGLEFMDWNEIANGKVELIFTHASDWVIVVDEEPYIVDDVSSDAGIEEECERIDLSQNSYNVVGISLVALAISVMIVIVYRKRRQK